MTGTDALAGFAAALTDPSRPLPDGLTTWNGSDVAHRFAVYRNNVVMSLTGALAVRYPVVRALVGEEFFAGMARLHVSAAPPISVIMAAYGAEFPDFIAVFPPAAGLPYLADVARLESARVEAHHAADAPALTLADFAGLPAESLADLHLTLHPSTRIVRSRHAIVSLWQAHQHGEPDEAALAAVDTDSAEDALVVRPDDDVLVYALPPGAAGVLAELAGGTVLGTALSAAAEAEPAFDPTAFFSILVSSGVVSALANPGKLS